MKILNIKSAKGQTSISLILLIIISSFSCSSENCQSADLPITNLEDVYQCVNTKYQMQLNIFEDFVIINTQEEFENLISGSCSPKVDFEKYTLIAGKKGLPNGNTSIAYKWTRNCPDNDYILHVTFFNNATTEAPNLTYHVLVDKIESGSDVAVEIQVN